MKLDYWWDVGDQRFYNKWAAELYSQETGLYSRYSTDHDAIKFYLQDASIDDNYDYNTAFVKQLRDEYKTIRLYYTGGFDSHTMLLTFLNAGLSLDDICVVTTSDQPLISETCDLEYTKAAFPFLESRGLKYTNFLIDVETHRDLYKDPDWIFKTGGGYPIVRSHSNALDKYQNFHEEVSCNLLGKEKPLLLKKNGSWYCTFFDNGILDWNIPNRVMFWLDPRNIKSFIKDARLLRKLVIEKMPEYQNNKTGFIDYGIFGKEKYSEYNIAMGRFPTHHKITMNNSMSKATGRNWCNQKDKEWMKSLIDADQIDIVVDYYSSWDNIRKKLPSIVEEDGFINRWLPAKCPWFINIDTLEYIESENFDLTGVFDK